MIDTSRRYPALLFDPETQRSLAVEVSLHENDLTFAYNTTTKRISLANCSLSLGGWQGDALQISWPDSAGIWALTINERSTIHELKQRWPRLFATEVANLERTQRTHRRRRNILLTILTLLGFLIVGGIASLFWFREPIVNSIAHRLPPSVDIELGKSLEADLRTRAKLIDGAPQETVQLILNRLLKHAENPHQFQFRIYVIRDDVPNAFAAPGGLVVVHSGLIKKASQPEMIAGVLAHEIGHVLNRHSVRQLIYSVGVSSLVSLFIGGGNATQILGPMLNELSQLHFSREQERDADAQALTILRRSKVSPSGLIQFFDDLAKQEGASSLSWLSTHPASDERSQMLRDATQQPFAAEPILDAALWEKAKRTVENTR